MRTIGLCITLLLLTACASDGGGGPALTVRDYALVKVSGDGQQAVVKLSGTGSADRTAGRLAFDVAPAPDMFPEPLVVKVVPKGGASLYRGSLGPTSPAFDGAPAGLPTVTWHVVEEGCGAPFTSAEQPGSDSTVATFLVKGPKAGICHVRAQTVERDSAGTLIPVVQQEFEVTQLPGPAAAGALYSQCTGTGIANQDTLDAHTIGGSGWPLMDANWNPIPWRFAPFGPSTLYTVTPDSQAIVVAPVVSGIDSVRILGSGALARVSYVYVRPPQLPGTRLMLYNWPPDRQCGEVLLPAP